MIIKKTTKAYIMLVLATLFWAGNFVVGKIAFIENVPPFSLTFFRWLLVWLILIPFTYKEFFKLRRVILDNFLLLLLLGLTSVGLFNSFIYNALNFTQVINASLFNAVIPVAIILFGLLFKLEKTNKYQILGLIISILGILSIITKLDLDILLTLSFNKGDILMIGAVITWGIYSAFLKKRKFEVSLLTLVHILCTFGLVTLIPQFLFEFSQGKTIIINDHLIYSLIYLAIFPSIGSYYCWAGAVSIIGANRAGIFLSLIPLFSTILAMIFFDEKFLFFHFIGSVLIILGLLLSNKKIKNA
jgi:drug/metabolite transporter (DMT)-like permease